MRALDRTVPRVLDLGIDLFIEVRYRARADPRAPQGLRNILHPAHRNACQIHLDQRLLERTLPALAALSDRCLKRLPAQLRYLQPDIAGFGVKRSVIACPHILARLTALIPAVRCRPV